MWSGVEVMGWMEIAVEVMWEMEIAVEVMGWMEIAVEAMWEMEIVGPLL